MPLLALLIPLLPGVIQFVEQAITKGKSGKDKMDAVTQIVRLVAGKLAAQDGTTDTTITDDAIRGAVEAELARMKTSGTLGAPTTVPGIPDTLTLIVGGRMIPFTQGK